MLAIALSLLAACSPTTTTAGTAIDPTERDPVADVVRPNSPSSEVSCTTGWETEWQQGVDAIVFLDPSVSDADREHLREVLETVDLIESFAYVDQAGAYAAFEERFEGSPQLRGAVRPEDVPTSFQLRFRELDGRRQALLVFLEQIGSQPGVFEVADSLCHG